MALIENSRTSKAVKMTSFKFGNKFTIFKYEKSLFLSSINMYMFFNNIKMKKKMNKGLFFLHNVFYK